MLPEYGLNGKVALVTGAGRGLGEQIALALAEAGADVSLAGRDVGRLKSVAAAVGALGRRQAVAQVDVQNEVQVARMVAQTHAELGRIDILVNNAGIFKRTPTAELSLDRWSEELRTNLTGPFLCMKAVQPIMVGQGGGVMINIASVAGIVGRANLAAYCASKAAVSAFFESLRLDLMPRGIAVTIIHPGFIKTDLTAGRAAKMPYLMELEDGVKKIVSAIEKEKKIYTFPWQLATIVRAGMLMPVAMYDWIAARNSFRE